MTPLFESRLEVCRYRVYSMWQNSIRSACAQARVFTDLQSVVNSASAAKIPRTGAYLSRRSKQECYLGAIGWSLWLGASILLAAPSGWAQSIGETIGEAYDLGSNELLYRETHCLHGEVEAREVIYHDDQGKLLAHKFLDYRSGTTTPSFVQHNLYLRETIEVALEDEKLTMSVQHIDAPDEDKSLSIQPGKKLPLVIDAGFDTFVRIHWDALVAGEKKYFQFPFAERSDLVKLRLKSAACSYLSTADQCFKLELSNWFLRLLVAPIELGYDSASQRLTRYRGLSNIGDEKGAGQVVDIRYDYNDIPPGACRLAWSAPTEPLNLLLRSDEAS